MLPLHCACSDYYPRFEVVQYLTDSWEQACILGDGSLNLPIHLAIKNENPCVAVIQHLLILYPRTLNHKNQFGETPKTLMQQATCEYLRERYEQVINEMEREIALSNAHAKSYGLQR